MEILDITDKSDLISDYIDQSVLDKIFYNNRSDNIYALESLCKDVSVHLPYKKAVILIKPKDDKPFAMVRYTNYKEDHCECSTSLAVIYMGHYILDIFHSEKIIPTSEYMDMLRTLNPAGLRLDRIYQSSWRCSDGSNKRLTIEDIYTELV